MRNFLLLALFLPFAATAQDADDDRWMLGLGASVRQSPYAGEGTRVRPFPLLRYEGERVFWRGLTGGVHLYDGDVLRVDALAGVRFDGFDIEDLGATELRANGVDPLLLEDRDDGIDAGLRATWRSRAGSLRLEALADVSGTSKGQEVSLEYGYRFDLGRLTLQPNVGARWMSSDLANYYYGVLDEEIARGVTPYRTGSALVPKVGMDVAWPLVGKWALFGALEYEFLPSAITDSPLMEPDTDGTPRALIGISRSF